MPKYIPKAIHKFQPDQLLDPREIEPKQTIHFLSIKATSIDGYEQALKALTGKIITLTTTPQHLIVVTE